MKNPLFKNLTPEWKAWFLDRTQFALSIIGYFLLIGIVFIMANQYPFISKLIAAVLSVIVGLVMALLIFVTWWCIQLEKTCAPDDDQEARERAHYEHWNKN